MLCGLQFLVQYLISLAAVKMGVGGSPPTRDAPLAKTLCTSIATGLDIGLSNWSLYFISISFYTMCR